MKRETAERLIDVCFTMATILFILSALSAVLAVSTRAEAVEPEPVIVETVPEKESLGEFEITAYCPCETCCGAWADGIAYTGGLATEGQTIAVDPAVIPLGSVVEIGGHHYIAEDIGGAIDGNKLDIYCSSHSEALKRGRLKKRVYIKIAPQDFARIQAEQKTKNTIKL